MWGAVLPPESSCPPPSRLFISEWFIFKEDPFLIHHLRFEPATFRWCSAQTLEMGSPQPLEQAGLRTPLPSDMELFSIPGEDPNPTRDRGLKTAAARPALNCSLGKLS